MWCSYLTLKLTLMISYFIKYINIFIPCQGLKHDICKYLLQCERSSWSLPSRKINNSTQLKCSSTKSVHQLFKLRSLRSKPAERLGELVERSESWSLNRPSAALHWPFRSRGRTAPSAKSWTHTHQIFQSHISESQD